MGNRLFALLLGLVLGPAALAQRFELSTNAATWACLGTINAQFEYGCDRHWSIGMSGKYNPFTFNKGQSNQMQLRQRSVSAQTRWWPWHIYSGWWLGADVRWQEYNMGGVTKRRTEEGWRLGAGVTAGYSYMLAEHLNLEFGLRLWTGYKKYAVYECPTCGRSLESGAKAFVLPDDLILSLSYVF